MLAAIMVITMLTSYAGHLIHLPVSCAYVRLQSNHHECQGSMENRVLWEDSWVD